MKAPKNQHQQVLYYLYEWHDFSLKDVINDSMFYKFQSRLSELEAEHGPLATRRSVETVNRFARPIKFIRYTAIDKNKLLTIYKKKI